MQEGMEFLPKWKRFHLDKMYKFCEMRIFLAQNPPSAIYIFYNLRYNVKEI